MKNELLDPNQSGVRSFSSCVNQLLSISHDFFFQILTVSYRAAFLDITKTFRKFFGNTSWVL